MFVLNPLKLRMKNPQGRAKFGTQQKKYTS